MQKCMNGIHTTTILVCTILFKCFLVSILTGRRPTAELAPSSTKHATKWQMYTACYYLLLLRFTSTCYYFTYVWTNVLWRSRNCRSWFTVCRRRRALAPSSSHVSSACKNESRSARRFWLISNDSTNFVTARHKFSISDTTTVICIIFWYVHCSAKAVKLTIPS